MVTLRCHEDLHQGGMDSEYMVKWTRVHSSYRLKMTSGEILNTSPLLLLDIILSVSDRYWSGQFQRKVQSRDGMNTEYR